MDLIFQKTEYDYTSKNGIAIIQSLCDIYEIKILTGKFKNLTGRAYYDHRAITIPIELKTIQSFLTAIHEINHIIINDTKLFIDYDFSYEIEYDTEIQTIKYAKCQKFINKEEIDYYVIIAKDYVYSILLKEFTKFFKENNYIPLVPKNHLKWLNVTQEQIFEIVTKR